MEPTTEETPKERIENAVLDTKSTKKSPTPPQQQEVSKKSKKEDRSKKDDKTIEQFMKSFNSVPTLEEKLSLVCKKYIQTADDNKKLQFYIKQSDKRHALLQKEKDQLQHEYNKAVLVKSKLENLCRELQKQNKAIKEESLLKIREEEERRKETQAKFQSTLTEITALLQQNNEKNAKLRDDNISMSDKFNSVVQQYQLREQQVDKMAKQMSLESQLSDAKLQKAQLEHQAEKERMQADIETMKVTVAQARAKILEQQGNEAALRSQLAVYTDKYDEFQGALTKSNQLFGGFKEQMEKMSKKIKKLEKESLSWKQRWESTQAALLDMCSERQAAEERIGTSSRQLLHMQGLCRTLQAERTILLNTLKDNNIERPPLPAPVPAPAPAPATAPAPAANNNNAKVDAMAVNCAQLRESLAHLQTQLNVLTNNKNGKEDTPPKQEKNKKNKSKKNKDKAQEANKTEEVKVNAENEVSSSKSDTEKTESSNKVLEKQDEIATSAVTNDIEEQDQLTNSDVSNDTVENLIETIKNGSIDIGNLIADATVAENNTNTATNGDASSNKLIENKDQGLVNVETCGGNDEISHIDEVKTIAKVDSS